MSSDSKPKLSIVLPAMLGYKSILPALNCWEAQTCRGQLEILVLCPDHLVSPETEAATLRLSQILVPVGAADLHEARAIGVQRASGDYVMLAEDHCLPNPDWAEVILDRVPEGWDAIACALRPGNRTTCWARAAFLIGYGEWFMPAAGGPTQILCGWNGTIRTKLLQELGPELAEEFVVGAFLVRRLRRQDCRFYLEDRATMRHFDRPGGAEEILLYSIAGMGFGAVRTRSWPWLARLFYPLAAPAIGLLHARRAVVQYVRARARGGLNFTDLAASFVLACAWGLGEAAGAWMGTVRVAPYLSRMEVKPPHPEEVARSNAEEGSARADTAAAASGDQVLG